MDCRLSLAFEDIICPFQDSEIIYNSLWVDLGIFIAILKVFEDFLYELGLKFIQFRKRFQELFKPLFLRFKRLLRQLIDNIVSKLL